MANCKFSLLSTSHHFPRQAFVATGFNLIMNFDTSTHFNPAHRQCDFDREVGKVRLLLSYFPPNSFFSDLGIALFPISMGSGQTARASSPATQHQILTRTLESSKAPVSPPQSGYTHPSPSRVQLLSAANTAFSHNCPAPQVPSVQSPPLSPSPSPQPASRLPTIVDLFMALTVTRLLLKSLLPLSRTNKQSRRPQVTSCTFQLLHSFTFYIRYIPSALVGILLSGGFPGFAAESQTDLSHCAARCNSSSPLVSLLCRQLKLFDYHIIDSLLKFSFKSSIVNR